MNETIEHRLQLGPEWAGQRLDQAAGELLSDYSRARLQRWIKEGALQLDGRSVKPSQRLSGGEWLTLQAQLAPADDEVLPEPLPLELLFEDEDLIVLNKPAGLVVHPAAGHATGTLQNGLLHHRPELAALPRGGIVHRLDKDTTGVMVVAASLRAHRSLVAQLQARTMSRIYKCVALGDLPARGTVDAPIGRHPRDRIRMAVVAGGKPAVTHFRRLEAFAHFSHLEVSLESGRTHQIRVHLQHLGHALAADPLYGRSVRGVKGLAAEVLTALQQLQRQALHARTLRLQHPASEQWQSFDAPLPDDLLALLAALREADAP
ncbi:MAG: RluA family pseudouridine synthase [Xanthomonadales bacterium]|nr:RluA family pseudouridine synthase [Xanthomonadales bacterium]